MKYKCKSSYLRSVDAESPRKACERFSRTLARRMYGSSGKINFIVEAEESQLRDKKIFVYKCYLGKYDRRKKQFVEEELEIMQIEAIPNL